MSFKSWYLIHKLNFLILYDFKIKTQIVFICLLWSWSFKLSNEINPRSGSLQHFFGFLAMLAGWQWQSDSWLVLLFGQAEIPQLSLNGFTILKFGTGIPVPHRMNPTDFGDTLTFPFIARIKLTFVVLNKFGPTAVGLSPLRVYFNNFCDPMTFPLLSQPDLFIYLLSLFII